MNSSFNDDKPIPLTGLAKPKTSIKNITFPRSSRLYIFFLFFFVSISTSIDQGIILTSINQIKSEMNITDSQYGLLSSLFYLGKIVGSLVFITIINTVNRKSIIIIALIAISIALFLVIYFDHFIIFLLTRLIIGFFQIFFIIYFPVWCDQFGIRNSKTCMITTIQLAIPMGIMLGCLFGTFINWKIGILIQITLIIIIGLAFLCVDNNLFSANIFEQSQAKASIYYEKDQLLTDNGIKKSDDDLKKKKKKKNKEENEETIWSMLKNKHFLFCSISRAFLFFPLTAMQIWTIDYMDTVLGIDDEKIRLMCFAIISAFSPLGIILGGFVGTLIGGYENKKATVACVLLYFGSCCGAILVPFTNTPLFFTLAVFLCLVFCAAIMPILTGVIISSVPQTQRGSANSVVSFLSNLLGHMPAPFVYGLINENYSKANPRLAMTVVLNFSFVCLVFLILAAIFRCSGDEGKENKCDAEKGEIVNEKENKDQRKTHLKKMSLVNNGLGEMHGNGTVIETKIISHFNEEINRCVDERLKKTLNK